MPVRIRGHEPFTIDKFNGLWRRGNVRSTPLDHFSDSENIIHYDDTEIGVRPGLVRFQDVASPLGNVVRMYDYITQDKHTTLQLTWDGTDGKIYHVVDSTTVFGPILTKAGMTDFAFASFAGRAYISPFSSFLTAGVYIEKGLQNEFVYVYLGAGAAARKASGSTPAGTLTVANGAAGFTDPGFKLFAVVGETDTGFLSAPFAFEDFTTSATLSVSFSTIPTFVGAQWVKRHIVATKTIVGYNGNTTGYNYYFIPNATVNDNVTTTLPNISFFDADLLEGASYLLDNFTEIPAGAVLSFYRERLVVFTTYNDISLGMVSAKGEPEAINQIDGLLIFPPDGNPVTNAQELREVLYVTKRNKTGAFSDNDDIPSSWPFNMIDFGIGAPVHGIATVMDSGSTNIDKLIMSSYMGIVIFNGNYIEPELSWKIADLWINLDRQNFRRIQLVNNTLNKILYCTLPDRRLLTGDYKNGMDPKNIKWERWKLPVTVNTIALTEFGNLLIGAEANFV